jgi:RPA family protein
MAGKQFAREVAKRLFALELKTSVPVEKTGNDEFEPKYVLTELGEKVNRVFICGVAIEKEYVGDKEQNVRVIISDTTGVFTVYANRNFQPEARAEMEKIEVPAYISIVGKVNTYSPPGGDRIIVSIRPESVNLIDEKTRDKWVNETSQLTLERVKSSQANDTIKNMYRDIVNGYAKSVPVTS